MRLIFPGTRGAVEERSFVHQRHTCLMVEGPKGRVLVDFGQDWEGRWEDLSPDALVLTHAHADHVGGLPEKIRCPVYASQETWSLLKKVKVDKKHILVPNKPVMIRGIRFRPLPVEHSIHSPAVALWIGPQAHACFYAPDVLAIPNFKEVLDGVDLYIGDGASVRRPVVRKNGKTKEGHASIRQQLEWCAEAKVPQAIFTHCGSPLVRDLTGRIEKQVCTMGADLGVETRIARDQMTEVIEDYAANLSNPTRTAAGNTVNDAGR